MPRNILIAGTRKRHASSGTPVSLGQTPIGFQLIRPRIEMCTFWKTASSSHETIIRWSYCSRDSIKNVQMLQYFLEESLVVMKGDIAGAQLLRPRVNGKNSVWRKGRDEGNLKSESLPPFEKYFPASRSRNLEEKAETFESRIILWGKCIYILNSLVQLRCVILLNNKQAEKLGGGFTRFTGSEVFGKWAFFTLRLKSTNWIKIRSRDIQNVLRDGGIPCGLFRESTRLKRNGTSEVRSTSYRCE